MSWEDRVKEGAYTSPGGVRLTFDGWEDVSREVTKKTAAFNFPEVDGTYVQDLKRSGRRYPLRIFFTGDDCDLEADAFEALLLESGAGILEHPFYGRKNVVPFGDIGRRDNLKTAANQAIVEVTFWETIPELYPLGSLDPEALVAAALEAVIATGAATFADSISLDLASERVSLIDRFKAAVALVKRTTGAVAAAEAAVNDQFNAIVDSINASIDTLVGGPLALAFQAGQLLQLPGQALTSIRARLDAYGNLFDSIIGNDDETATPGLGSTNSNNFHNDNLYASGAVAGSVVSVVNNVFTTRTEALEAAEEVLAQWDRLTEWQDDNFQGLGQIDTGEAYQKLLDAVTLATAFLVELSFSLKQERSIILETPRDPISLTAELYGGNVDDNLDFFITSNDLQGNEFYELPKGRRVVWFV